jgi:hypothetical protein
MRQCFGRNKKSFEDVLDILSDVHLDNVQDTSDLSVKNAKKLTKKYKKTIKKAIRLLKKDKHHENIGKSLKIIINHNLKDVEEYIEFLKDDHKLMVLEKALLDENFNIVNMIGKLDVKSINLGELPEKSVKYLIEQGFELSDDPVDVSNFSAQFIKYLKKCGKEIDLNNCINLLFDKNVYKSVKEQLNVENLSNLFEKDINIESINQKHLRDILVNLSGKDISNKDKLVQTIFNLAVDLGIDSLKNLLKKEYGKYIKNVH